LLTKYESDSFYTSKAERPSKTAVLSQEELEKVMKAHKYRAVSEMLVLNGTSQTSKVRIGGEIYAKLPQYMKVTEHGFGRYIITSVTHEYDLKGKYRNTFTGIPQLAEYIPVPHVHLPKAFPQIAVVKSNNDTKQLGRVKVEFPWQLEKSKTTNWIRVQSDSAGKSGAFPKNRGIVFIPEVDDIVMIDFEHGDPSRPFVAGSIFSEKVSIGGGIDNVIKSITTRSGHMIEFNDEVTGAWGTTVKDICGNRIHLSTKAKSMELTTPETLRINAKNIQINANESIKMSAGEDIIESAGKNKTDTAGETLVTSAKNKNTFVEENSHTDVKKSVTVDVHEDVKVTAEEDVNVKAGKLAVNVVNEDTFIESQGKITLKRGDIVDVAQG
jgi:uncharacterized protein involved in type VI secretion and phage assembly